MPTVANSMLTGHLEHGEEVHGAQSQQVAVVFAKVLALVKGGQLNLVEADNNTHTHTNAKTQTDSYTRPLSPPQEHTHTHTHTHAVSHSIPHILDYLFSK